MAPEPEGACLAEDELLALADGSATPEERSRANRHLDGCDDCRRVLAAVAQTDESEPDDETPTVTAQRLSVTLPAELASRYVLLREMRQCALYVAYVARDRTSDELVALDWVREDLARQPGVADRVQAAITRARAIAGDTVVSPRECHLADGVLLIAVDLVASDDLAALLRARGIGPDLALEVVIQLLGTLAAAHRAGVTHGQLRTENVLVDLAGHVQVADFGLSDAIFGRARTQAELALDDTQAAARLALTLLERCGGSAPAVTAILESALEHPGGFPSAVELSDAVARVQLERRPLPDRRSVGREREWMPTAGAVVADRYVVEGLLGRGGMGAVVTAKERESGRRVAIKLMPPRATKSRAAVERFLREGRAASAVASEHVVRVLEVGQSDEGAPYIVMEHLEGSTLGRLLKRRGALPVGEALDYVLQACVAVAECHAMGIVHRDLKPDNLMVLGSAGQAPKVKVLDFGVSKSDWLEQAARLRLTGTADVLGTPTHMSPEQVRSSKSVDARTDIWALGVILYEALTGKPPFLAENLPALCAAIVSDEPLPPRALVPSIPAALEALILRCLEKHPDARPFSVRALAEELAPFASEAGLESVEKIRGIGEASVPRTSVPPPPPRLTPIPPALTVSTAGGLSDTATFSRQVSTRRRSLMAAAALLVSAGVVAAVVLRTLDDEVESSVTAIPAATLDARVPEPALETVPQPAAPAGSADAGPAGKRRIRPAGSPLDSRL
ncbi:MAG: protein kinase [Polyangiaceae bacterium]|nr:protein kinase [Polyangiaceae bacterium]